MNKNYKNNLKVRNIKEKKTFSNNLEYIVKKNSKLLDYLINDLHYSRNNAKSLLSHSLIGINGVPIKQFDYELVKGDLLVISKNPIRKKKRSDLPIIFEDDNIVVINKPFGLLSIASDKEKNSTAYRMVSEYLLEKDKHSRIYVVHRLDKETSGILMFAKNDKIKNLLQDNWNDLVIKRGYYAVCEGIFTKKEDTIINYLKMNILNLMYVTSDKKNSRKCITKYKVIKENKKYSLLDIEILTGRKNQIRVTLGSLNHFVLGDDKYGEPENPINRLCLHSYELKIKNPLNDKIYDFKIGIPKEFNQLMK